MDLGFQVYNCSKSDERTQLTRIWCLPAFIPTLGMEILRGICIRITGKSDLRIFEYLRFPILTIDPRSMRDPMSPNLIGHLGV